MAQPSDPSPPALLRLIDEISPGVDPADVEAIALAWSADQPGRLAEVTALAATASPAESGAGRPPVAALLADPATAATTRIAIALAEQARYGNPRRLAAEEVSSWRDVGYTPEPYDGRTWPEIDLGHPRTTAFADLADAYDVVVIGSACGSIAARLAAEAGARVLLVERGGFMGRESLWPDPLRNQRLNTGLVPPAGPPFAGNPRVNSEGRVVGPDDYSWNNNAFTLGGGTRVFGAQAWRFCPEDFQMASQYGTPEGSSLADWPIGYDDMAPYYDRAEHDLGVSGDPSGNPYAGSRTRPYPMPPLASNRSGQILSAAADRLGWSHNSVPLLINSEARAGRPACVQCGACVGFPCPAEAKNGTHNTALPLALATGRVDLVLGAVASRLVCGAGGAITDVEITDLETRSPRTLRSGRVVLAAGAVETARLLLLSAHEGEPDGVGNNTDQVGRHLQAHMYTGAVGVVDEIVQDCQGPGPTVSINGFRHANHGIIGGGMLANDFVPLPMATLDRLQGAGILPEWGPEVHQGLSRLYRRHLMAFGPIQEVTTADARVRLSPTVTDALGLPVAAFSGSVHEEDLRTADFMADRSAEWLGAAGATRIVAMRSRPSGPSGGQHQAGTCRMGDDPATSVVDPHARVWGHPNLYVADTSVHVTNGGVNPVLTAMAGAYRTTTLMLAE
jgi:choline dehydrogenase-like flavoprotein